MSTTNTKKKIVEKSNLHTIADYEALSQKDKEELKKVYGDVEE